VSRSVLVRHEVVATMESMTRYVRHEVVELVASIEAANAAGLQTGGLRPIAVHPLAQKVDEALVLVLEGNLDKASGTLRSAGQAAEAFLHALKAVERKTAPQLAAEWRQRAEAIRTDLEVASASTVPPAPLVAAAAAPAPSPDRPALALVDAIVVADWGRRLDALRAGLPRLYSRPTSSSDTSDQSEEIP
jgi:hypothetical protein